LKTSPTEEGCIICFAFGLKHIGVAVGQTLTRTARGVVTLAARQGKPKWPVVDKLIAQYEPFVVVVGLPLNMDGRDSDMATRARAFSVQVAQRTKPRVVLHDERLTSVTAKAEFKDAKAVGRASTEHELAACFILESWLNEQPRPGT